MQLTHYHLNHAQEISRYAASIVYSPDGSKYAVGYDNGDIEIRSSTNRQVIVDATSSDLTISSLAWKPDGTELAVGLPVGYLGIIKLSSHGYDTLLENGVHDVAVSWNAAGTKIAATAVNGRGMAADKWVNIWDTSSWKIVSRIGYDAAGILDVAWHPDGTKIATGSADGVASIIDVTTGADTLSIQTGALNIVSLAWDPTGDRLATASSDGIIRVWQYPSGEQQSEFIGSGYTTEVIWSPDGSKLAINDDVYLRVLDAVTGQMLLSIEGNDLILTVAWSPDGNSIAFSDYGDANNNVKFIAAPDKE
ncbi:MAG: PD40 domain-containing protein [Anaerolineae bacterium]|nr:PD40 domain-containing protein [Anaerolineae bacterium]